MSASKAWTGTGVSANCSISTAAGSTDSPSLGHSALGADSCEVVEKIKQRIHETCPSIEWRESYVTLGVYDVVDIVVAPDPNEVKKATMIIRKYGGSEIQTMVTTPWEQFIEAL